VSGVYCASTFLFHSRAHREAIEMSGICNGTRLLEVATGSGEMLRRLVQANLDGQSVGLDLSPKMAARALRSVRRTFPKASACCSAVDARYMPFPDGAFDRVICCYLLELLSAEDIVQTLLEIRRVLRRGGGLTLLLVGQKTPTFNGVYEVFGKLAPAFWGRQVSEGVPDILQRLHFRITGDRTVYQIGYPSRILTASRIEAPAGTFPSL
jgi:ubiquinone/menaquinone biosynthesis C-methylase UbiE